MNIMKWFGMLAIMLALTGFVMAEGTDNNTDDLNDVQGQALNVRYDHLQCKVDFTNTQIDTLNKYVTQLDQSANKDVLVTDMNNLKVFVTANNKTEFDAYVTNTLIPDLNKASQDLSTVKTNFKQYNLSNETRTALISELTTAKKTYSACIADKEVKMSKVMEKHMEKWSDHLEQIMEKMDKKNITTENMTAIIAEMTAKHDQLQQLINSGNITKMKEFMKEYQDLQFHYAAKFEVARLNGYKDKLESLADKYNQSDKMKDIDKKIHDLENYTKEDYKSKGSEHKKVLDDIKALESSMKDTAKNINNERLKERSEKLNEKEQKIEEKMNEKEQKIQEKMNEREQKRLEQELRNNISNDDSAGEVD